MTNMAAYYLKKPFSLFRDIFTYPAAKISSMDYADYWTARGESSWTARYDVFSSLIEPGTSLLDIGCGDGFALKYLAEKKSVSGEGVDISEAAVRAATNRGVKARAADITAAGFEISGVYDYILISEVIEHIARPEDLLRKIHGHFRKGLIVSIPNSGHYIHRLRLLFGRFPVQWMLHPGEHLRFWTLRDFRRWSEWLGFRVAGIRTSTGVLLLSGICPALFADNLVFLLKDAGGVQDAS
ncbi:MAG TPA: hypothetical protein DCW72_02870 [Elusimicrobia bacterium]|nr:MAG: hypothetical protein A2X29_12405 [Elusimicrobia bacterium GWA2_64_40]OGR64484.1 MAG: hypothetical protein A2X30_00145 [Elusimicrobia bacterium GWB2_63_16]HAU89195.1 hypothetical protein [Elusimicrobiota bacterium]